MARGKIRSARSQTDLGYVGRPEVEDTSLRGRSDGAINGKESWLFLPGVKRSSSSEERLLVVILSFSRKWFSPKKLL